MTLTLELLEKTKMTLSDLICTQRHPPHVLIFWMENLMEMTSHVLILWMETQVEMTSQLDSPTAGVHPLAGSSSVL